MGLCNSATEIGIEKFWGEQGKGTHGHGHLHPHTKYTNSHAAAQKGTDVFTNAC